MNQVRSALTALFQESCYQLFRLFLVVKDNRSLLLLLMPELLSNDRPWPDVLSVIVC